VENCDIRQDDFDRADWNYQEMAAAIAKLDAYLKDIDHSFLNMQEVKEESAYWSNLSETTVMY
jgi:hypothetical protein